MGGLLKLEPLAKPLAKPSAKPWAGGWDWLLGILLFGGWGGWGLASGVLLLPRRCVCVALCLGVSFGSCCRLWLRVVLMCFQLVQLSRLVSGDSAL